MRFDCLPVQPRLGAEEEGHRVLELTPDGPTCGRANQHFAGSLTTEFDASSMEFALGKGLCGPGHPRGWGAR